MANKYIAFSMNNYFFPEDCLIQKTRRNLSDVKVDECKIVLSYGKDYLLDDVKYNFVDLSKVEIVRGEICLEIEDSIFLFSKSDGKWVIYEYHCTAAYIVAAKLKEQIEKDNFGGDMW